MFRLIKGIYWTTNHTKCVTLSNQKCEIQVTIINLHPDEYIKGLRDYPVAVNLDRCVGSCNNLNGLSNKVSVSNKTED